MSPYALLWDDENYYLIGYDSSASAIRHYRVDKIFDLRTAGDGREGREAFAALDMSEYTSAHFGMFSGTPENVRLECRDTLAGAVIDRFGADTMLIPSREGYFTVTVPVAVSAPSAPSLVARLRIPKPRPISTGPGTFCPPAATCTTCRPCSPNFWMI